MHYRYVHTGEKADNGGWERGYNCTVQESFQSNHSSAHAVVKTPPHKRYAGDSGSVFMYCIPKCCSGYAYTMGLPTGKPVFADEVIFPLQAAEQREECQQQA